MTPKLASVLTPRDLMGRRAAEVLLARLRGELPPQQIVDVGFELLRREYLTAPALPEVTGISFEITVTICSSENSV